MPHSDSPLIAFAWEQRKLGEVATEIVAGGDVEKDKLRAKGRYPVLANALTNEGIVGYYESEYRRRRGRFSLSKTVGKWYHVNSLVLDGERAGYGKKIAALLALQLSGRAIEMRI